MIAALIAVGVGVAIAAVSIPVVSYVHKQNARMELARQQIPLIRAAIANDSRFRSVTMRAVTEQDGCLQIFGDVTNPSDVTALQGIVAGTRPPIPVEWMLPNPRTVPPASRPE